MRLKQTEGTVHVADGDGISLTPEKDLALYSGCHVGTAEKSYAWIDLDKAKLTKLDQNSEIEIQKENKALTIEVVSGSLFFNVTEPLAGDETMKIRTSSLLVGIRGTCGWGNVPDAQHMELYLLEGKVECTAGTNTVSVSAGEKAMMTADGEITVSSFAPEEVPPFVAKEIKDDEALLAAILDASGLDLAAHPVVLYGDVLSEIHGTILHAESIDLDADGSKELMVLYLEERENDNRTFVNCDIYRTGPEGLTYSGGYGALFYIDDNRYHEASVSLVESGGHLYLKWHEVHELGSDAENTYIREENTYCGYSLATPGGLTEWSYFERFDRNQDHFYGELHEYYLKSIDRSDNTSEISAGEYEAGLANYREIRMIAYTQDNGEIVVVAGPAGE